MIPHYTDECGGEIRVNGGNDLRRLDDPWLWLISLILKMFKGSKRVLYCFKTVSLNSNDNPRLIDKLATELILEQVSEQ